MCGGAFLFIFLNRNVQSKHFRQLAYNVKVLCVCGGLVALTVSIAPKLNRITAVDFSTSTAITQNTCYAQCFLSNNLKIEICQNVKI